MKWNFFLIAAVAIFGITNINAQVTLAGWDITGQNSSASNPLSANNTASNITVVGLTLGGGLTASSTGSTFGGTTWTLNGTAADAATNNDFIFLTLTANAGYTISLNGISAYNIRRSSTGPNSFLWQYQVGAGSWTDIGSSFAGGATTTSAGNSQAAITLSGIPALQGVSSSSTIGLRILGWGATNTGGTGFLNQFQTGDDFIITGSVASASAFTTWTGTGSAGVWSNGTAGQLGGNYANDLANTVTFTGTATNVTASGPVQAGSLIFNTDSYILGGAVQLGVGSITTTGSITTNITASISGNGSSGLIKAGEGTLILSGNNSYSGTTTLNAGTLTIGNATALGSTGNITFSGGALQYGSGINTDLSPRIRNSVSAIIVDTNNNNVTFGTALDASNTGGLTKQGTGTLTLSVNNTLTGPLQVTGGTLSLSSGTLSINTASASTISGTLSGSGSLTKQGAGTLTITNNNSGYSGETRLEAGVLEIGNNGALGTGTVTFRDAGTIRSTDSTDRTLSLAIGTFTGSNNTVYTYGSVGTGNLTFSGTGATALGSVTRNLTILNNSTTFGQSFTGTGAITKSGAGTLIFTGNSTYAGATTINAGTLQIGNGLTTGSLNATSAITVNGTLAFNRSDDITQGTHFSTAAIGGTGSIVQNGAGTITLNAANNYSGGTTLNTGTLVIGHAGAAGSGTITQANATSLLKFDTVGTITNAMLVHNVLATQSATLSGAITVNNATWDIDTGDTLTISGNISGPGGLTKNGSGTLVLSGSNSYSAPTVINAGTLNATSAGALGNNATVQINGGTLLVTADDAINGKNIKLGGSGVGLQFSGNYSGAIGSLTLSADSIIDMGPGSVQILFQGLSLSSHTLSFYNWTGSTLWNGGTGADTDKVFLFPTIEPGDLNKISFYSGNGGDSFLGTGFDIGLKATGFSPAFGNQILPVPEPETWATAVILLVGGMVWFLKRARHPLKKKAVPIPHGSLNETE
jgi:fibronectin-binding autotransporter adhesin